MTPPRFVIVGASLAGAKAAETLRPEGYDGRVVLVGEEPVRPYERPPLSKDYLRGEATARRRSSCTTPASTTPTGSTCGLPPGRNDRPRRPEVVLDTGERIDYDAAC